MKELVEYIAKSLASFPDDVKVTEEEEDDGHMVVRLEVKLEVFFMMVNLFMQVGVEVF